MKCEVCHNADAETAIVKNDNGAESELYVCRACAKAERAKRQKKSQRTRKTSGLPPGMSITVSGSGGEPPPFIGAILDAVHGMVIFIIVVTFTKNEKLKRLILSFMLPSCLFGGIAAILIPTQSARNGMWIITAQYFLYHIALIIFSLHLFTSKELKLTIKDYFNCLKFLVGIMFFAIYINSMMYDGNPNINFMYVVSPPQDGLPYLNENQGWFMYMLKYASVVILCVSLVYIKPIISCIKEKFHKKSSDTASIQIADSIEDSTKSDTNE